MAGGPTHSVELWDRLSRRVVVAVIETEPEKKVMDELVSSRAVSYLGNVSRSIQLGISGKTLRTVAVLLNPGRLSCRCPIMSICDIKR